MVKNYNSKALILAFLDKIMFIHCDFGFFFTRVDTNHYSMAMKFFLGKEFVSRENDVSISNTCSSTFSEKKSRYVLYYYVDNLRCGSKKLHYLNGYFRTHCIYRF